MRPLDQITKRRFEVMHWLPLLAALLVVALLGAWLLLSQIPRHIVLASGPKDGMYHQYAQRYKAILARDGVTVEERLTPAPTSNEQLLRDPSSGVDVAFVHGGVVRPAEQGNLVMLAAVYYEPLWIFYRAPTRSRNSTSSGSGGWPSACPAAAGAPSSSPCSKRTASTAGTPNSFHWATWRPCAPCRAAGSAPRC